MTTMAEPVRVLFDAINEAAKTAPYSRSLMQAAEAYLAASPTLAAALADGLALAALKDALPKDVVIRIWLGGGEYGVHLATEKGGWVAHYGDTLAAACDAARAALPERQP